MLGGTAKMSNVIALAASGHALVVGANAQVEMRGEASFMSKYGIRQERGSRIDADLLRVISPPD